MTARDGQDEAIGRAIDGRAGSLEGADEAADPELDRDRHDGPSTRGDASGPASGDRADPVSADRPGPVSADRPGPGSGDTREPAPDDTPDPAAGAAAPVDAEATDTSTSATPARPVTADQQVDPPSFAKGLFVGDLHQDLVTPYPKMDRSEQRKVAELLRELQRIDDELYDPHEVEECRWIGDEVLAALGESGLLGLYIDPSYGGQGLSQTGYCRVSEEFGRIDATLAVVMGVHQSIGAKGIHLFGTDEQKERFLPDLAVGRKLAAFALTEPTTGSDAYDLQTRAERESDGSWRLNGEKRWIGNGNRDVVVCFARSDEHGHVALILTPDMEGFESPFRYDTMGLRGNDLRHLTFKDVRVPPENVLGEPGDGFKIAMNILNDGRMSLGTGSVGAVKKLIDLATEHVQEREQFGQPLAEFEMVQEKIAWMTSYLYGLEAMSYLTTGMMDAGVEDVSLESAMVKVAGTEFLWYAANRAFQLAGGEAYMNDRPYAKILRDIRIFPIFEGSNDVLRAFIALSGLKVVGDQLEDLADLDLLGAPVRSGGLVLDHVVDKLRRRVDPPRLTHVHPELRSLAGPLSDQVGTLRSTSEGLLRRYGRDVRTKQLAQKRLAHAAMDITAQVATLSRVTALMNAEGAGGTATERFIAETYCTRAARRVERNLEQIDRNDDDAMLQIARVAYRRGGSGFELYGT